MRRLGVGFLVAGILACCGNFDAAESRFDSGTGSSPVMKGFNGLTADDVYDAQRGYGWQGGKPEHLEFDRPVRDNRLRGSFGQSLLEEA